MEQSRYFRIKGSQQEKGLLNIIKRIRKKNLVIVEIGSAYGESAEVFLSTGRVTQVICVDTWTDKEREVVFDARFENEPRIKKVKGRSEDVASRFPDNRYDLIYIDAIHTYEGVMRDVKNYQRTLKKGCWIGGHDYNSTFEGVISAVNELYGEKNVIKFCDGSWLVRL
jgi:cephalosporin hydroxylase